MSKQVISALFFLVCLSSFALTSEFLGFKNIQDQDMMFNIFSDLEKSIVSKYHSGANCAGCEIILSTFVRYSNIHSLNAASFIQNTWCNMFSGLVKDSCGLLVQIFGPDVESYMNQGMNPDQMCQKIGFCTEPQCTMFPADFVLQNELRVTGDQVTTKRSLSEAQELIENFDLSIDPFSWLTSIVHRFSSQHLPILDLDGDKFGGDEAGFRGYHWRGRDCDDTNANIYPGRQNYNDTNGEDYNCNGISGKNDNGVSYKDLYCKNSGQIGIAVIGDSAGAHFEIPPKYMDASQMSADTYNDLVTVVEDEIDLPYQSASTGYYNSTTTANISSVYKYLYERNKCNFRDFQNIAVNGGDSSNTINNMQALKRDPQNDYPLLVILELIGNDVCGSHIDRATPPATFKQNILTILNNLNNTLPAGSHVMIYGLAQGTALYQYLHGRNHPLGITYDQVYDFLNCLQISPCAGWMNSNETIRNETQAAADALNQVYRDIVSEGYSWKQFDYVYYDFPFTEMMAKWTSEGGQGWQLIEPCDGFHPNQQANALFGDWIWNTLVTNHPTWIGEVNPNNDAIESMFGNQGGY